MLIGQHAQREKAIPMFRGPWELDSYIRHHHEHLARERRRCSQIDRIDAGPPRLLTQMRRRIGVGLIRAGSAIAGNDALRGVPTRPTWPELANR